MAFLSRLGNILRQGAAAKQLGSEVQTSKLSILQAVRFMSSMSSSKLFIGGLSYNTDDQSLREAFTKYGDVVEARVIMDRETGRSRGFGFVTYTSTEEASSAIQALDGQDLHGRQVRVNYATDRARGFGGGGGGGGYGGGGYGGGGYGGGGYSGGGGYGGGSGGYGGGSGGYDGGSGGYGGGAGGYGGGPGGGGYNQASGGSFGNDGNEVGGYNNAGGSFGSGGISGGDNVFGGGSDNSGGSGYTGGDQNQGESFQGGYQDNDADASDFAKRA